MLPPLVATLLPVIVESKADKKNKNTNKRRRVHFESSLGATLIETANLYIVNVQNYARPRNLDFATASTI